MGEQFQRLIWHPHWKRAEAEDAEMKILVSGWVSESRKRKLRLMWMARLPSASGEH
jgi:hypothetical protein